MCRGIEIKMYQYPKFSQGKVKNALKRIKALTLKTDIPSYLVYIDKNGKEYTFSFVDDENSNIPIGELLYANVNPYEATDYLTVNDFRCIDDIVRSICLK